MALDPSELQWLTELTKSANDATKTIVALNMRLRLVEGRNKSLWGLSASLLLLFLGTAGTSLYRGGSVDAMQTAQGKQIESVDARLRAIEQRPAEKPAAAK
jgi:hypothetical protein